MERIYNNVRDKIPFPLFTMNRGRFGEIDRYRKSGNGVLFASDSVGEGIDLAGDILSSIIVREKEVLLRVVGTTASASFVRLWARRIC